MSDISPKGGAWSFASRASTVFGSSRFVTASNRVKPRAADSSNCRTLRLTAGSRINFGWLTRPHSRRMLRYNVCQQSFPCQNACIEVLAMRSVRAAIAAAGFVMAVA